MGSNKTFAKYDAVQRIFFDLKEKKTRVHFGAEFTQYDLLAWLLENITGKAHIIISSYTASEELGRMLLQLREHKLLEDVRLILDSSAAKVTSFNFLATQADKMTLTPNHSKTMLLLGDECAVAVLSSANMNYNPRFEQTLVSLEDDIIKQTWEGLQKIKAK